MKFMATWKVPPSTQRAAAERFLTGGAPMPAFTDEITRAREKKRRVPSAIPIGTPTRSASTRAEPQTHSVRSVISATGPICASAPIGLVA